MAHEARAFAGIPQNQHTREWRNAADRVYGPSLTLRPPVNRLPRNGIGGLGVADLALRREGLALGLREPEPVRVQLELGRVDDRAVAAPQDQALRRENESADVLARNGYDVEQSPPPKPNGKQPDYLLEGRYFDCYAPLSGEVDQVRKGISRKVRRDQADRLVLNLADTSVPRQHVADILRRRPIANLEEIIVVDGEQTVAFYPLQE